jgi:hypothetical protein
VKIALTAGPDAGRHVELATGSHLLGRAPHCSLRIDDPALEAHHLIIDVGDDGGVELAQLAGRAPVMVDGTCADGWATWGRVVEVGESRLELVPDASPIDPPSVAPVALAGCADPVGLLSEAARVRRDVHLRRASTSGVSLGVGTLRLPIDLVDARPSLPIDFAALLTRAEWHDGLPILVDIDATPVLGLVDELVGRPRARAVARSLTHQAQNGFELVVAAPNDPALEACHAVLEIGARWRARWTPDVNRPGQVIRLHAAGMAVQPGCSSPKR